jgi:hypothetical protein
MSLNAVSSAALPEDNVYVADSGPPASEFASQLTCASAFLGVATALHSLDE